MTARNKSVMGLSSPIRFKNRRTSLNVNLSYVSSTSLLADDNDDQDNANTNTNSSSLMCDRSLERTVINRLNSSVRRNLSLRGFKSSSNKQLVSNPRNTIDHVNNIARIKPSFVKMVRIRTSTPLTSRSDKVMEKLISEDDLSPSENTKRSSVLEDVRFPLHGEIFSPEASIVMETSMDMTEVQGAAVLNADPVVNETLNVSSGVDGGNESSVIVQDTEDMREEDDVEERIGAGIIPDSEQDSINTVRTSLNVNTSLDSRFSTAPNNSIYDPRNSRVPQFQEHDIQDRNNAGGILSYPISESSDGNLPLNSVIVTTALIEHDPSNRTTNYHQETQALETTVRLQSNRESNSPLSTSMQSENNESNDKNGPGNDSRSTDAPSLVNQNKEIDHLRISISDEDDVVGSNVPELVKNPIKRGRKKLFRLRESGMIDLSPVSVQMVPGNGKVPRKRGRKVNKTAKKMEKKGDDAGKTLAPIYTSDDDIMAVDIEPRKEKKKKKARKVKTKKIVIKKMADVGLWKRLNGDGDTTNDNCEDISSALGRTSLNDFEPKNNSVRRKSQKIRPRIVIVATGLPIEQKILVKSTVATLGSAKLEKIVTRNTTHVVGRGTRTVNLLRGLVRGCWLVSFEWISKSSEAGEWVDPEEYEITNFSKAVQENRKEKQLFGTAYVSELFLTCGLIHIKEETSTPAPVLKELVRIAGGRVATNPEEAKIIIGRGGFKEIWILDSITNGKIQPLDQYCKKKCLNQD